MPASPTGKVQPVYLVKGDDPALIAQEARVLVERLVEGGDQTLGVEEFGGPSVDPIDVGRVIDACTTLSFLVPRRVVLLRDAGQLTAADAKRLSAYLSDPLATTVLVLVSGAGTVPAALAKQIGAVGEVLDTTVGRGKARSQWLVDHLHRAPVRLDTQATSRIAEHLGGDMGRLSGLLGTLTSAYGAGATVTAAELEPFLGEPGSVAPWELTDAIDASDTARSVAVLRRILGAAGSHPLVVLGSLHRHYRLMLRLDGSGATTPELAAPILGLSSAFQARKALNQGRRLGSAGVARALALLVAADLDIRGSTALPGELVLEVLVARLSRLAPK